MWQTFCYLLKFNEQYKLYNFGIFIKKLNLFQQLSSYHEQSHQIAKTSSINFNHQNSANFLLTSSRFKFSTSATDPLANLTFEQLLQLKSTQSLTKAAQIMAELQIQHQNLTSRITMIQEEVLQYPEQNKALMDRIKNLVDNVKLQEQENSQIEKRAQKQLQDAKKYAISKVAKQILEVSDNLERSIKHSQKICKQTHSQVKLFYKELQEVFKKFGIEEFDPVGKEYDPNTQESMVKISFPETMTAEQKAKKSNRVVQSFRTGYMIKGRLLRSAHVVVYE